MWKKLFGSETHEEVNSVEFEDIDLNKVPRHIAIIMDGNGRWAQKQGLLRTIGHKAGVDTLKKIVKASMRLKIEALSVYAFSTENWKRPHEEVNFLMNLFSDYLKREIDELDSDNTRIQFMGRIDELSKGLRDQIENAQTRTAQNTGLVLNVAVNYGSRDEITRSVKIIAKEVMEGKLSIEDISERTVEERLYTAGLPPLDLVIRPSGDLRVSNFLLWQIAYAEFWFTKINWPDFKASDLFAAVLDYQKRDRRFGGLNKK